MFISLAGKAAVVTGAGRGIGLAAAKLLSEAGASVLLVDIDEKALIEAQSSFFDKPRGIATLAADLALASSAPRIIETLLTEFGAVDIVVNNAGYTWDNVVQKTSDEQFQAMLDIHVGAPFRLLRAASGWIREQAKKEMETNTIVMRKVVNVTSISGLDGNPGQAGYASGKAAVVGLTKTLAKEWGRYNVNVNAVGFGLMDTRLTRPMEEAATRVEIGERKLQVGMQTHVREQATRHIPLGRLGTAQDAANAIFFLCSPLSDYITAETLVCGGGLRF